MKKIFIGIVAFAMCLGLNSCKKETAPETNETASTEQTTEGTEEVSDATKETTETTEQMSEATKQVAESEGKTEEAKEQTTEATRQASETTFKSAADLLAKAKAQGANWSVDEWKAAYKEMLQIAKPMLTILGNITNTMKTDPKKAMEMNKELMNYEGIDKTFKEFKEFIKTTPNGKIVDNDKEWYDKVAKELGIPKDL